MGWGLLQIALLASLGGLLLAAGIEDAHRRTIGNAKTGAVALLAPLWWLASGVSPWPDLAIQLGVAALVFALFCAAFHFGQMGGGDVKLIGALALWLPPSALIAMLIAMALMGGAVTLLMVLDHKLARRSTVLEVPYGVAIAVAGLLALREPVLNQFT
jgi:prepilin peptidase CpaA